MPEGDTIFRTAATLRARLEGRTLTEIRLPRRPELAVPAPGTRVTTIEARGKHLLIGFDDGRWLHTHMRMTGSWHTYRAGGRWRRPGHTAVAVLRSEGTEAVCFSAPVVEMLTDRDLARHPRLATLGPDLCAKEPDLNEVHERMRALAPTTELGVALLDQRVASGIGNVYKSEVCWAAHVDPFTPLSKLDHELEDRVVRTAWRLLRRNLDGGPRVTHGDGLAVYGKAGRPCPRCGTPIASRRQGSQGRTTWWCPACQQVPP